MKAPFMILLTSDSAIIDAEKYGFTITWVDILHNIHNFWSDKVVLASSAVFHAGWIVATCLNATV